MEATGRPRRRSLRRALVEEVKALAEQSRMELQALLTPWRRADGSIRADCELAGLAAHLLDAVRASKSGSATSGGLRRALMRPSAFESFPADRYGFVRAWGPVRSVAAPPTVVAADRLAGGLVLLTCFPKAVVTEWQVEHAWRTMRALSKRPRSRFQRALRVWDAHKNWVLVQEFNAQWTPAAARFSRLQASTERSLHDVIFQVASLVHYLHAHGLSLAGELRDYEVMMLDGRVTLMLNASLVVTGCSLVSATDQNKAADVAAIGMLMFQFTMAPYSPPEAVTTDAIQDVIEDQLSYLSPQCRDVMFECLVAKLSVDELLKRKWMRNIDFISISSKRDCTLYSNPQARKMLYNSLIWKLATYFVANRCAFRPNNAQPEDEDAENRQRSRRQQKRYYGARRSFTATGSAIRSRRSAAMLPFGTSLVPSQLDNTDAAVGAESAVEYAVPLQPLQQQQQQQQDGYFHAWNKEVSFDTTNVDSISTVARVYDGFTYASFMTAELYEGVEYDNFFETSSDAPTAPFDSDNSFMMLPNRQVGNGRVSLTNHGESAEGIEREILRSLHVDATDSSGSTQSDSGSHQEHGAINGDGRRRLSSRESMRSPGAEWREITQDAVFFSAFGPKDIARRETFRVDIWAYLKQQRASMLESALEQNDAECATRLQPLRIERGTLVTVSMDTSTRLNIIGEDCKSFRWTGEVESVSFDLARTDTEEDNAMDDDELCTARIIVGTKVSMLFIRLRVASIAEAHSEPSVVALLESDMEHVKSDLREISQNDLELLEPIGSGAFGSAMLARWKAAEASEASHVVVKTLREDAYTGSDALQEELRHEAAVMHMLGKHPHVVELLGITSTNATTSSSGATSIVTEYLSNGSVEDLLGIRSGRPRTLSTLSSSSLGSNGSSPPDLSLFARTIMARDAAHGLANIHQARVLHRDIAARNCLVDANFRVKVGDFGLSRRLPRGYLFDDEHHGFGPVKWMAPESVLPPHVFSTHSDTYMFGVLMYEIFSGRSPFPDISPREAMALILEGKHVPIPSSLPSSLQQLMTKCFDVHPVSRPSMDEIFFTLDRWVLDDTRCDSLLPAT